MDAYLQELKRKASTGDVAAQEALDLAICRTEGHDWEPIYIARAIWANVKICKRCLATEGIRFENLPIPDIFSFRTSRSQVYHGVAPFTGFNPKNIFFPSLCFTDYKSKSYQDAVGRAYDNLPGITELLRECNNPVTCKKCISRLVDYENKHLLETAQEIFSKLLSAMSAPAIKKAKSYKN